MQKKPVTHKTVKKVMGIIEERLVYLSLQQWLMLIVDRKQQRSPPPPPKQKKKKTPEFWREMGVRKR